jgi:hypothetical protein
MLGGHLVDYDTHFRVARRCLDRGAPAMACELFAALDRNGFRRAELSYYWALAILSGRSWEHIGTHEFQLLRRVLRPRPADCPPDLARSLWVLERVVDRWLASAAGEPYPLVGDLVAALEEPRRGELRRHLAVALRPDPEPAPADRAERVRLFLEREPDLPEFPEVAPLGYSGADVAAFSGCVAVGLLGLALLTAAAGKASLPETVCALGVLALTGTYRKYPPVRAFAATLSLLVLGVTAWRGEPFFVVGALLTAPFGYRAVRFGGLIRSEQRRVATEGPAAVRHWWRLRDGCERERRRLRERRADDAELAGWLHGDLLRLRKRALASVQPAVLGDAVLAAPARGAAERWAPGGLSRWDRYAVTVLVYTADCLLLVGWELDLATGAADRERRQAIPYAALVTVVEEGATVRIGLADGSAVNFPVSADRLTAGPLRTLEAVAAGARCWFEGAPERARAKLGAFRGVIG